MCLRTHLGRALQQTRMQIEHITWVSLSARGATKQQRHLAVGDSLLREVVVDDQCMHAIVAEVLAHDTTCVWCQILQRSSVGRSCSNDGGKWEAALSLKGGHEGGNGGALLADSDINTIQLVGFGTGIVNRLLIKDGIKGNSSLASLTIADDQLTLTTAD